MYWNFFNVFASLDKCIGIFFNVCFIGKMYWIFFNVFYSLEKCIGFFLMCLIHWKNVLEFFLM